MVRPADPRSGKHYLFIFLSSVKPKATWAILKPHFETLVATFVYPQLCFTPMKQELWETDPVDYTRTAIGMHSTFTRFTQVLDCLRFLKMSTKILPPLFRLLLRSYSRSRAPGPRRRSCRFCGSSTLFWSRQYCSLAE